MSAAVGLICGAGSLPIEAADAILRSGRRAFLVGIRGAASEDIARFPHGWMGLGEIGKLFRMLDQAGAKDLAIVGAVQRPALRDLRLDVAGLMSLPELARLLSGGDDSVLRGIVAFLETRGYRVHGVHQLAPELTAALGALSERRPSAADEADIAAALAVLTALGPFDVGQGVVALGGRAVAVEAAEGTDRMVKRVARLVETGKLRRDGRGGVLVKVPKLRQDLRVDLPAIGETTVKLAADAGLSGIAVAAGRVLVADREKLIRLADALGLFVVGVAYPVVEAP